MTKKQDTNSTVQAEAGKDLKDVTQNKISSTPEKDALADGSLDDVSGGVTNYVLAGGQSVNRRH